ncbi:hemolysin family protein [Thermosynechococcus sp. GLH187]|uniref:hemolysin family protein n=1 Tax=unclassified Thermosynechococcus TaxID=2622553 RepID=UPI00287801EE|nr:MULTISPECIES: hemolysin family protein [unclassified Thermosynechococcus]WNC46243.1 hemolysin family protein [Thermosynechococcus sp. GLH187]WNC48780.1 hemolysin family protein [Thermosynechococcus sp. GLH333]WNC51313.1 hemolysin family protein [Thermosynechococcus sp. GLH87]
MSAAALEILLVLLLIIANGIFAGAEIAVVSARKVRLEQLAKRGQRKAKAALKLANSPNNFLSAVQIGITLIGILSGAVGGATLAQRLQAALSPVPWLGQYSQPLSIALVVTGITYLSLVIGELVPKRIAMTYPEAIACNIAKPMTWLTKLAAPIVHLLSVSTDTILQVLGITTIADQTVTEDEIKVLIEQGAQAGLFEVAEQDMVARIFNLGDRPIQSIMTPRTDIVWLDIESSLEEIETEILASSHSRFPVAEETIDHCLGIISAKDFLAARLTQQEIDLRQLLQPALFVPEGLPALDVLELFRQSSQHIALITDEYGGIEGLVTLNDLTEAIIGTLRHDEGEEPQIIQREDGSWLLDGLLSTYELKELLRRESLPEEDTANYHTLGGLIITLFGRIPQSGDYIETDGLRFEVVDMDGNRVDKVLVTELVSDDALADDSNPKDKD